MPLRLLVLFLLILGSGALAGCAQAPAESLDTTTTTIETTTTTDDDPDKGDNLLSVTPVSNSTVANASDSATAVFSELNQTQQSLFLEAYNCSCTVNQDVFRFNDDDRIKYVYYHGQWYYLRVAIV